MTPLNTNKNYHNDYDLFPEFSKSLFYFIGKLHNTLIKQGVKQVYFLSREGQPLMRMFDMYQARMDSQITSYYLEVSRRSTLLPSLGCLAEENFDTLFRQYRQISLLEFLSSLGLEKDVQSIAKSLGLSDGAEMLREKDFPTSPIFEALKALPKFQSLFESERLMRRRRFIEYLLELSGGTLSPELVIVDVGWKGTIQDNLFNLLCREGDPLIRTVTGYYVGLVSKGSISTNNRKFGLLFSSLNQPSKKFRIFNENRALFEVLLAADHGSIVSYDFDSNGRAHPVRGAFEEGDMLFSQVFPVQRQLFKHFEEQVALMPNRQTLYSMQFKKVVRAHARMVFNPTRRERVWFSSVFHVENYGVFEHSHFSGSEIRPNFIKRMYLLTEALRRRDLGFWPWLKLYELGGYIPASIYAVVRMMQK
jgi:hypothetical protein